MITERVKAMSNAATITTSPIPIPNLLLILVYVLRACSVHEHKYHLIILCIVQGNHISLLYNIANASRRYIYNYECELPQLDFSLHYGAIRKRLSPEGMSAMVVAMVR